MLHEAAVGADWSPQAGRRAILDLPADTAVTAVIAANDVLAAAAIHGASERGWSVPDDLSVTGWDDNPMDAERKIPSVASIGAARGKTSADESDPQLLHGAMRTLPELSAAARS